MAKVIAKANAPVPDVERTASNKSTSYKAHKLAELVPGEMEDAEFDALVESIKADGQQFPIILFEGQILDGRHRYRACTKLGIAATFKLYTGKDPSGFVLDSNLHRRQLNSMQKALVGARMHINSRDEEGKPSISLEDCAKRVGVGKGTLHLCVRLFDSKNTSLIRRTEKGETTRAEVDELIFDRTAAAQAVPVDASAEGVDDGDEMFGDTDNTAKQKGGKASGNVTNIADARAKRNVHPERRSTATPAHGAAQAFKALNEAERRGFVELTWHWLEPLLQAMGKLPTPAKVVPAAKPVPVKVKAKAKGAKPSTVKQRKAA